MNENLADLLWSLVPVLALWLIYAVVAIMRAPLQVLNAAVGAVEAERKGQQTRADDAERKIAATAAVEAEKPSVYVEFIEDKSTEAKRVDRIRVTNTSSKLITDVRAKIVKVTGGTEKQREGFSDKYLRLRDHKSSAEVRLYKGDHVDVDFVTRDGSQSYFLNADGLAKGQVSPAGDIAYLIQITGAGIEQKMLRIRVWGDVNGVYVKQVD